MMQFVKFTGEIGNKTILLRLESNTINIWVVTTFDCVYHFKKTYPKEYT